MVRSRRHRPPRRLVATVAIAAALAAGACGSDDAPAGPVSTSAMPSTTAGPATSTITAAAEPSAPTTTEAIIEPMSILLAGDSLARDIAPGTRAALETAVEPVEFRHQEFPIVPRLAEQYAEWDALLAETEPDVVLMYIGVWETMGASVLEPMIGEPGFAAGYRQQVLDPWFDSLREAGVHTILLGMASIPGDGNTALQLTVDASEEAAASRDDIDFVRTADVVSPDGYVAELPDPRTGDLERVRRVDGHLCADGVERVVDLVLERIGLVATLTIDDDWRDGPWRLDSPVDLSVECPPLT